MTRSARSAWNFATVLAFSAVSMGVSLIVTPILLRQLGQSRLGGARAVMDWTGYLSLLELGLGGALSPLLAHELAKDDQSGVRDMMAAGFRAYIPVAIAMVTGGLILAGIITRLIRIDPTLHRDLRMAALIGIVPCTLITLAPLRLLAEARQRGYVVNLFLIVQSVTIAASAVTFAKLGLGIAGQMMAIALGAIVLGGLLITDSIIHARSLLPTHFTRAPEESRRRLWRLNTPTLIMNVCGRVGLLTDNIIIGSMLSAGAIVPFLMTQRLAQLAQAQLQSIGSATWAGLAELHARGEHDLFRARFLELTRLVTILGLLVLVPILIYNHSFVRLWVGEPQYAGITLTSIAACNALILSLASLWGWIFSATAQIARLVPLLIGSATLNLAISLGLTGWLAHHDAQRALWGPVIGTSTAYLLLNMPLMPILLRKHFDIPVSSLLAAVGGPMIVAIPCAAVVTWVSMHYPPTGWITLAMHMSISAIAFGVVSWIVLISADERRLWRLRLRLAAGRGEAR